jgi:hypothetical protein
MIIMAIEVEEIFCREKAMRRQTFATVKGFGKHGRKTRWREYLSRMEALAP